jgi:hypothetical protein
LAEGGLKHDTDRVGQYAEFGQAGLLQRIQPVHDVFPVPHFQYVAGIKKILHGVLLWYEIPAFGGKGTHHNFVRTQRSAFDILDFVWWDLRDHVVASRRLVVGIIVTLVFGGEAIPNFARDCSPALVRLKPHGARVGGKSALPAMT